jgi:hypothetical protein
VLIDGTLLSDAIQRATRLNGRWARPLPEAERRLRTAFPDIWADYQRLSAARSRETPPLMMQLVRNAQRLGSA